MKNFFFLVLFLAFAGRAGVAATLTWKDNSGFMPGCTAGSGPCDAEDGFAIQKLPAGASAFTEIDRVGANVTTYVDKAADAGDCYRIAAFNVTGISGFSNIACLPLRPENPSDLKLLMEFSGTLRNDRILATSSEGYQLTAVIKRRRFTGTLGEKR